MPLDRRSTSNDHRGFPTSCAVCTKCVWDLRTAPPGGWPQRCIYGGPYKGYVAAHPDDALINPSRYWIDPKLAHLARKTGA